MKERKLDERKIITKDLQQWKLKYDDRFKLTTGTSRQLNVIDEQREYDHTKCTQKMSSQLEEMMGAKKMM